MRPLIYFALLVLPTTLIGQTLTQKDLTDIVRVAFEQNRLPSELTATLDSLSKLEFPNPMVVIMADPKMGTDRQYDETSSKSKVMVWYGEDIFLHYVLYWMTPTETLRRKNIV